MTCKVELDWHEHDQRMQRQDQLEDNIDLLASGLFDDIMKERRVMLDNDIYSQETFQEWLDCEVIDSYDAETLQEKLNEYCYIVASSILD